MAISYVHYQLLKEHAHLLKHGGSLLEIGEANWYGDADPRILLEDAKGEMRDVVEIIESKDLFRIAKAAYHVLFEPSYVESIDMNGTWRALRYDLNLDFWIREYDTVINHGTAEHIFNIAQVFRTMHDACIEGGIMIHESPFTGWIDHGFYCLQPTLFYDLAAANDYELISLSITQIESRQIIRMESREHFHSLEQVPNNALLFVVLRKKNSNAFRVPMQGYYEGRLSEAGNRKWSLSRKLA